MPEIPIVSKEKTKKPKTEKKKESKKNKNSKNLIGKNGKTIKNKPFMTKM